jgi:hypothetical protein
MAVKLHTIDLDKFSQEVEQAFENSYRNVTDPLFRKMNAAAKKKFDLTIQGWSGGTDYPKGLGYVKANTADTPKFFDDIIVDTFLKFQARHYTDNWLWIQTDEGRPPITVPAGGKVVFPAQTGARTQPNKLSPTLLDRFFTGEWVSKLAGDTIGGVEPRNWLKIIADELDQEFTQLFYDAGLRLTIKIVRE